MTPSKQRQVLETHEHMLALPFAWSKPRMVFVNSMGDLTRSFSPSTVLRFRLECYMCQFACGTKGPHEPQGHHLEPRRVRDSPRRHRLCLRGSAFHRRSRFCQDNRADGVLANMEQTNRTERRHAFFMGPTPSPACFAWSGRIPNRSYRWLHTSHCIATSRGRCSSHSGVCPSHLHPS
jgi:hypothetical protein